MKKIRWAIAGTGYIANEFARGMQEVKDAELKAVVSRTEESGRKFAEKYGCGNVYTELRELFANEKIDVLYIAIPNDCHFQYIMTALDAGVSVLSEKPMVDNRKQLDAVLKKAKEKHLFLMEGMWTRCFPAVCRVRDWIKEGRIGRPLTVRAGFDIKTSEDGWQVWKGGIRHAGGALRDVGIYSLAIAEMVFDEEPEAIYSNMKSNGEVDESFHMLMAYSDGRSAFVSGAFNQANTPEAEIVGESGRIMIGKEFWHPDHAKLILNNGQEESFSDPYPSSGFQYEICAVQKCMEQGAVECPYYTWKDTLRISDWIESSRKKWGIYYEADKEESK